MTLIAYVQREFLQFASAMYPDGVDWQSDQHRDIVRVWVAACFTMDTSKDKGLERLASSMTADGWQPDESWQWRASEQN